MGYLGPEIIAHEKLIVMPEATLFHFDVLTSTMHMAWMRAVGGRLKSDYSYSPAVYNSFPWPDTPRDKHRAAIQAAAQGILDARAAFPDSTLADLYDPTTMPPVLVKAHQALDRAVDAAYGKRRFDTDAERVAFRFDRYQQLTSLLPAPKAKKPAGARTPREIVYSRGRRVLCAAMIRFRPRRWLPLLRVVVLGLFSLSLVLQPVMATAGEMHVLAHDPTGSHAHDAHSDDLGAELDAGDEKGEDGARTLHVLLHFAHCCGATAALLLVVKPIPAMPADARLASAMTPMPPQARLASPFKPPISA